MPSTKPRIRVYIDPMNKARLAALAARPYETESSIVDRALSAFFAQEHEVKRDAALIRRLDRQSRQLENLKRDQGVSAEAFALFMRYFLTVIPPVPETDKAAAQAKGQVRFERYLDSLRTILGESQGSLLKSLNDIHADASAYFTQEELQRLHEPKPEREAAHA